MFSGSGIWTELSRLLPKVTNMVFVQAALSPARVAGKRPSLELTWLFAELSFLSGSVKDYSSPQLPFVSCYMGLCNVTDCINIPSGEKSNKKNIIP